MHEGTSEPLSPQDREEILVDIEDLEVFQTLLEPRGVRGMLVDCAECEEQHYFEWELLRANLRHVLDVGSIRVHEPAYQPDATHYVTWDYGQGFVDGVLSASDGAGDDPGPDVAGDPTIDLR
jgi:hypothetical protein